MWGKNPLQTIRSARIFSEIFLHEVLESWGNPLSQTAARDQSLKSIPIIWTP